MVRVAVAGGAIAGLRPDRAGDRSTRTIDAMNAGTEDIMLGIVTDIDVVEDAGLAVVPAADPAVAVVPATAVRVPAAGPALEVVPAAAEAAPSPVRHQRDVPAPIAGTVEVAIAGNPARRGQDPARVLSRGKMAPVAIKTKIR